VKTLLSKTPKKRKDELPNDEEEQLTSKLRLEGNVDRAIYEKFKKIVEREYAIADQKDLPKPSVSYVFEMLMRKGIKAYELENK